MLGIMYKNICVEYRLEVPELKWATPPKVIENDGANIPWDFQIQHNKMMVVNQQGKKAVVVYVTIPRDFNIRKNEHEMQGETLRTEKGARKDVGINVSGVPVVLRACGAVTLKLGEGLQSEISVQKSAILRTAKILRRTLSLSGLCKRTRV